MVSDISLEKINIIAEILTNLQQENQSLKEKLLKLEDKYIHNVPCCNEEDCDLFRDYQSLKDRIEKAEKFCKEQKQKMYKNRNKIAVFILSKIQELLKGDK